MGVVSGCLATPFYTCCSTWVGKMAESINLILESMLPHLEELQQAGIFQENEIRLEWNMEDWG